MGPGKPFVPSFPEGPTGPGGPYGQESTRDINCVIGFLVVTWWTSAGTSTHSWSSRSSRSSSTLISSLALKKIVIFRLHITCTLALNCNHFNPKIQYETLVWWATHDTDEFSILCTASIHLPEVQADPADQWNPCVPSVLSHQFLQPHPCHHEDLEVPGSNKTIKNS